MIHIAASVDRIIPLAGIFNANCWISSSLSTRSRSTSVPPIFALRIVAVGSALMGLLGIVWVNVHDNQMDIAETAHRDG